MFLADEARRLSPYFLYLGSDGNKETMLHLKDECTWRQWIPDMTKGKDKINWLEFQVESSRAIVIHQVFIEILSITIAYNYWIHDVAVLSHDLQASLFIQQPLQVNQFIYIIINAI